MSVFSIIITRWLLFFRKLARKLQRCWNLLVAEEEHSHTQSQRLDSVLPSLFDVNGVIMFFDKTWRQHIDVANQLLDSGVDVNSLYRRHNILNNLVGLLAEYELEEPAWCEVEMVQAMKRLMLRVIRAGVDLNHRSRHGERPMDWYHFYCRNIELMDILKELVIHGANLDEKGPNERFPVRELIQREWPVKYQELMQLQGRVLANYVKEKAAAIGFGGYEILRASVTENKDYTHTITEADIRCPIAFEPMTDPVVCSDGHSYQRSVILSYIDNRNKVKRPLTSPMNPSETLNPEIMIPNYQLRSLVSEFIAKAPLPPPLNRGDSGQGGL